MGVILILHHRASLQAQMMSLAGTVSTEFAENAKMPLLEGDTLALNLLVENILKNPGIADAYIVDENMAPEGVDKVGPGDPGPELGELASVSGTPPWMIGSSGGGFTFAAPIVFKDTTVGYAVVDFSGEFIHERLRLAITSAVAIAITAIILVCLASIPISTELLRPLMSLFRGTREVAHGNLDYRIPETRRDEIGDLVKSFNSMALDLKKKEILKGVFDRYVSPEVASEILRDPERISLGGDLREVTVFFADIRGFTQLSRRLRPEVTVEFLNRYFTLATEITFLFGGTVDKFIGDAVMCVFGSPIRTEDHLERAIKAAVAIQAVSAAMVHVCPDSGEDCPLNLGIGIDRGEAITGNMGSQVRMEYTAVGDSVNTAAKLTDAARPGEVLITGDALARVDGHVRAALVADLEVKGLDHKVSVYRVEGLEGEWADEVDRVVGELISREGLEQREAVVG